MLRRKAYDRLLEWKSREGHHPLLVMGQRQTGKTFIIEAFGRENYDHMVKFDFSVSDSYAEMFSGSLDADTVINAMKLNADPSEFVPGRTLIFLDEIQECPRARSALKFLAIDGRYDVIASGSLIDAKDYGSDVFIPVGYEEHMRMFSLDFEEFLWAKGYDDDVIGQVRAAIRDRVPLHLSVLSSMERMFREFMIVGGMPEAVQRYVDTRDFSEAASVVERVLASCRDDMAKYNSGIERLKVEECFESIPGQLAGSNKKFQYSRINGGRSRGAQREYMESLLWIGKAGFGNFCYSLSQISSPLRGQAKRDQFRIYVSDTGMLMQMYGQAARRALWNRDYSYNFGALTENVVAECLMKAGFDRFYYRKSGGEGKMEIDFVLDLDGEPAAVEVKSGKTRDAPSISKVGTVFTVGRRIKFEDANISTDEDGIEHYPIFAAAFVDSMDGSGSL